MWIILVGLLTAISCALVGTFLVLKKMALVGDAISHAVLPGLALAFLITGSRDGASMLIGAAVFGMITVWLTEFLRKTGRIKLDASLGTVFTSLFAIGVILISVYSDQVDLDQECILYGEIAYAPWDRWMIGETDIGPRAFWITLAALVINIVFIAAFFKELRIISFDAALAVSMGIPVAIITNLLMISVSITTVATFENVGAILVVAMLIVPPASAFLLTQKLHHMLFASVIFAALSAIFGYYLAWFTNTSIAASMAVMSGLLFAAALIYTKIPREISSFRPI